MPVPAEEAGLSRVSAAGFRRVLLREVVPEGWDPLLRATGAVSALSILASLSPLPVLSDFATFFSLALFVNGPLSPLLTPVGFEPVLMAYGKLYSPLAVASLGVTAQILIEYANYYLYDAALQWEPLRPARESRLMERLLGWYRVSPFLTTVVVAFTPLPYWMLRITAPLSGYPVTLHLAGTAVGRFPRLWLIAAAGTLLPFPGGTILGVGLGACALFAIVALIRWRLRASREAAPERATVPTRPGPQQSPAR